MQMGFQKITYEYLVQRVGIKFLPGIKLAVGGGAMTVLATSMLAQPPAPTISATGECGCQRYCKKMAGCAKVMHFFNNCDLRSLNGDGDRVPREAMKQQILWGRVRDPIKTYARPGRPVARKPHHMASTAISSTVTTLFSLPRSGDSMRSK